MFGKGKRAFIETLQDEISKQYITTTKELDTKLSVWKYFTGDTIEPYEDVLSPMGWNSCDRCGALEESDNLIWVDYLDDWNETDKAVMRGLAKEANQDYCALCEKCVQHYKTVGLSSGE